MEHLKSKLCVRNPDEYDLPIKTEMRGSDIVL